MEILIVYGGNGLANDLSLAAVNRINTVLNELEVNVKQFNLTYDDITEKFLDELKISDGVVLATTVEWIGVGGKMQTFLDRCFLSGNREVFSGKYLMSVVLTKMTGDRDASTHLLKSWEILGGIEGVSICGKVEKFVELETNKSIVSIIDRKTEDFYRIINQKREVLPTGTTCTVISNDSLNGSVDRTNINIIDEVVGDNTLYNNHTVPIEEDPFTTKQSQDILELTDFFKQKLTTDDKLSNNGYVNTLMKSFTCKDTTFNCTYNIVITDRHHEDLTIKITNGKMNGFMGTDPSADVIINIDSNTLERVLNGKLTVQRGFLTGQLKAKGNFTLLYEFDHIFKL